MAKIISICNQKGGTGKTTTAINLTSYLALAGKKILLIDLDPQGNATSGLGYDKAKLSKNTYHVLIEDLPFKDIIVNTDISNLFLAPGHVDLTGAEVELVSAMGREYRLKKAISAENEKYDLFLLIRPRRLVS